MKVAVLIDELANKAAVASKDDYSSRGTLFQEFLDKVSALTSVELEIAEGLSNYAADPCQKYEFLWVWAATLHPSDLYFQSLCDLLKDEKHKERIWHEGIVQIFQESRNPQAVPCLEKALTHKLDYDPGEAAAILILETLADIGTPNAIRVLKDSLNSPSEIIREEARLFLEEL